MKKFATLIILILVSTFLYAKNQEQTPSPSRYEYCQIVGTGRILSHKVTIEIDYGQHRSFFGPQHIVRDENEEIKKFNSMIDALNYMGGQGWEFVQAYIISTGASQLTYHYLLRRNTQTQNPE